jgi:hypothetical protein
MSTALNNSYEIILTYTSVLLNFVVLLVVKKKPVVVENPDQMPGELICADKPAQ